MAEVTQFRGRDCWRTWFFDECEQAGLFGINKKHIDLLSQHAPGVLPYHPGTRIFLEDAPVFPESKESFHRICGPYQVQPLDNLPSGVSIVYSFDDKPILYLDPHPEKGPWRNGTRIRKGVCGLDLKFPQTAKQYNYYPYRFRICRSSEWQEIREPHGMKCKICHPGAGPW